MRKVAITCLLVSISVIAFTSAVFGGATINKEKGVAWIGYSVYTFAGLDFVIPDYLVLSDDVFEDAIKDLQADVPKEAKSDASIFAYEKDETEVYLIMQYAYLDWFFDFIKSDPSEQITNILYALSGLGNIKVEGIVESIVARGMDCYLSTSSFDSGYMAKIVVMFDEANSTCYSLYYLYNEDLDNTVYTDDFYKLLYTEPQSLTVASSTKDTATKDTADEYQSMHDYLDSVENVSSNLKKALGGSEEDQESMKSYYDALHDYVDAMQQLENAFN